MAQSKAKGWSGSFRYRSPHRSPLQTEPNAADAAEFPPKDQHRLRRVFTTHACRRRRQDAETPALWRMSTFIKKPLGIAHSLPLGMPVTFRLISFLNTLTCCTRLIASNPNPYSTSSCALVT